MLARKHRLAKKEDFERVKKQGQRFHSNLFFLSAYLRGDELPSRFGFVITKSAVPKAVDRNRIKRVISEVVRLNLATIPHGLDCVFVVHKNMEIHVRQKKQIALAAERILSKITKPL